MGTSVYVVVRQTPGLGQGRSSGYPVASPPAVRIQPRQQGSWGLHGAHLGTTGPRWAPCCPMNLVISEDILLPYSNNFKSIIFKHIMQNRTLGIHFEIAFRAMPQFLNDDISTLVEVMAWCCKATSHCLSQCCPRSMLPYGITVS